MDRLFTNPLPSYRFLTRDNEFYFLLRAKDGSIWMQAYGEIDAKDLAPKIRLHREWKYPAPELAPMMNMTQDGWIIMVTMDGTLIALSRGFTAECFLKFPSEHVEGSQD